MSKAIGMSKASAVLMTKRLGITTDMLIAGYRRRGYPDLVIDRQIRGAIQDAVHARGLFEDIVKDGLPDVKLDTAAVYMIIFTEFHLYDQDIRTRSHWGSVSRDILDQLLAGGKGVNK